MPLLLPTATWRNVYETVGRKFTALKPQPKLIG
jgi:hypothetical protein